MRVAAILVVLAALGIGAYFLVDLRSPPKSAEDEARESVERAGQAIRDAGEAVGKAVSEGAATAIDETSKAVSDRVKDAADAGEVRDAVEQPKQ